MIRPARVLLLPVVLLVPVLLTGCGSKKAGAGSGVDGTGHDDGAVLSAAAGRRHGGRADGV
ncbi:hypothetical protein [Streptomyces mirabilis]|uniref:hypothetical protein n=1 Tax=Streptomyces mirabilis TaxID=68239 RepID=UPI00325681F7